MKVIISSNNITLTKPFITLACLSTNSNSNNNNNNNNIIKPSNNNKPPKFATLKQNSRISNNTKQPSVAEVEQAIGAGIFRDYDPDSETEENKSMFDVILSNTVGKTEGENERKLRETGEWLNAQSEKSSKSFGRKVLPILFFWIVPTWFLLFFVAIGVIKLPSNFTLLNDFIM